MIAVLLVSTGLLVFLTDNRRKREEQQYYEAAYKILKEEYLDEAIRKEKSGRISEIGDIRTMLGLELKRNGHRKENVYVFDPVFPVTIGRSPEKNKLCLKDGRISSCHCQIRYIQEVLWLTDEGSSNGTLVRRGKKVYLVDGGNSMQLQTGDCLLMGEVSLEVRIFYFNTMYL